MCAKKNSRAAELARNLHQRYVSLNTGVCSFLPEVNGFFIYLFIFFNSVIWLFNVFFVFNVI